MSTLRERWFSGEYSDRPRVVKCSANGWAFECGDPSLPNYEGGFYGTHAEAFAAALEHAAEHHKPDLNARLREQLRLAQEQSAKQPAWTKRYMPAIAADIAASQTRRGD